MRSPARGAGISPAGSVRPFSRASRTRPRCT